LALKVEREVVTVELPFDILFREDSTSLNDLVERVDAWTPVPTVAGQVRHPVTDVFKVVSKRIAHPLLATFCGLNLCHHRKNGLITLYQFSSENNDPVFDVEDVRLFSDSANSIVVLRNRPIVKDDEIVHVTSCVVDQDTDSVQPVLLA